MKINMFTVPVDLESFGSLILCRKLQEVINSNELKKKIIFYRNSPLTTNSVSYEEVLDPCMPCYSLCAPYTCSTSCDPTTQVLLNFTLSDLDLPAKSEETNSSGHLVNVSTAYYLTGMSENIIHHC